MEGIYKWLFTDTEMFPEILQKHSFSWLMGVYQEDEMHLFDLHIVSCYQHSPQFSITLWKLCFVSRDMPGVLVSLAYQRPPMLSFHVTNEE